MADYLSLSLGDRRDPTIALNAFTELIARLETTRPNECQAEVEPSQRRAWIRIILEDLSAHLSKDLDLQWPLETIRQALIALKLLGRSAVATDDLVDHLPLLACYANLLPANGWSPQSDVSPFESAIAEHSLRILANTLFLHPLARASSRLAPVLPSLVESAFPSALPTCDSLDHSSPSTTLVFLTARILFLITACPSNLVLEIIENSPLVLELTDSLKRYMQSRNPSVKNRLAPSHADHPSCGLGSDVLIEFLKLIFNLMVQYPRSLKEYRHTPPSTLSNSPLQNSSHLALPSPHSSESKINKSPPFGSQPRSDHGPRKQTIKQRFVNQINLTKMACKAKLVSTSKDSPSPHGSPPVALAGSAGTHDQASEISSLNSSPRASLSLDEDTSVVWPDSENKIFAPLLPYLIQLFLYEPLSSPPNLKPPLVSYIHTFLNFPACPSFYFFHYKPSPSFHFDKGIPPVISKLLDIFDKVTEYYCPHDPDAASVKQRCEQHDMDLDNNLTHVMVLLVNLLSPTKTSQSPSGLTQESRQLIQEKLIPKTVDRSIGLNKQENCIGRLLRLMNSIVFNSLKVSCGGFLYALFNEDADHLVSQVGYGPIAGYLMTIGKPSINPTSHYQVPANVNPVTGAFYPADADESPIEHMTESEREIEAERLCELFDRMNRNGIIQVEDPRRAAVESGRFDSIDDKMNKEIEEQDLKDEEEALAEMRRYQERLKLKR